MKLTEKNQRVFYWSVIGLVLGSYLVLYSHYTHMEDLLDYTQQKSNRQLSVTVDHWHKQVLMRNEKIKLLERDIVMMQKHHLEEVMEVIEHAREKEVKD